MFLGSEELGPSWTYTIGRQGYPSVSIFNLKRDEHGNRKRFQKTALGTRNSAGRYVRVRETLCPSELYWELRTLLAVAASKGWKVDHRDIKRGFMYTSLTASDDVWIKLLSMAVVSYSSVADIKFRKSLNGLRKATKLYYDLFSKTLERIWFRRGKSTP